METTPTVPPRPLLHTPHFWREILDRVILIIAIYALINLASVRFVVEGASMEPTFEAGQFLIISRVSYLLGDPQAGDITVFHFPGNTQEDYIKRVIGTPGDVVEMRAQEVYVNGVKLDEPYLRERCGQTLCRDGIWQLGPDEFFMMGDNRNFSSDSRAFGPVNRQYIIGEVVFRYWPLSTMGLVQRAGEAQ